MNSYATFHDLWIRTWLRVYEEYHEIIPEIIPRFQMGKDPARAVTLAGVRRCAPTAVFLLPAAPCCDAAEIVRRCLAWDPTVWHLAALLFLVPPASPLPQHAATQAHHTDSPVPNAPHLPLRRPVGADPSPSLDGFKKERDCRHHMGKCSLG